MKLFFYGLIIGLFKVLPGISGCLFMVYLNIYEKTIDALNNIFRKENIIYLLKLFSGICLSILLSSKLLYIIIDNNLSIVMPIIIGIIIIETLSLLKIINKKIDYFWNFKIMIFVLIISLFLVLIKDNLNKYMRFFIMGILECISTIFPGISGTAIFSFLGWYKELLLNFSSIIQFNPLQLNIQFILPFTFGLLAASIIFLKKIGNLLEKKSNEFYIVVFLFSFYTIISLIMQYVVDINKIIFLIVGIILGIILKKINNL